MAQNHPPFIADARGSASVVLKGGDSREIAPNRPQQMGGDATINPDSIPSGGAVLKADPSGPAGNSGTVSSASGPAHKPFRLKGAGAPASVEMSGGYGASESSDVGMVGSVSED